MPISLPYHNLKMNRNLKTDSIILRTRRIAELHKGLSCLSRSLGLINVIAYGAGKGKSKLSGMVDPFSLLSMYLYYDPVKDSYKVNDIEQKTIFPNIRSDLGKFYIASFWAEIILKSYSGGGESESIYPLLADSLEILNDADKSGQNLVLLQFLWRYLRISGFQPDISLCGNCGSPLSYNENIRFDEKDNHIICSSCRASGSTIPFSSGGRKYLEHTSLLNLDKSMRIGLDSNSIDVLKRVMFAMIQNIVEYPLNTLKKGLVNHN